MHFIALPRGQKMVSVLLFEDMLIVPLLAIVALMSRVSKAQGMVAVKDPSSVSATVFSLTRSSFTRKLPLGRSPSYLSE